MNDQQALSFLSHLISIPSVSTDSSRKNSMEAAFTTLSNKLSSMGFSVTRRSQEGAHPLLMATRKGKPHAKSIDIYGHYDVQPEDPVSEWESPAFALSDRNGKLYGRGTSDNKGHIVQNIAAISRLIKSDKLDNTVTFLIEGEEEIGSTHFEELIEDTNDTLKNIDVYYITDVGMHEKNHPQLFYGLRGLVYIEVMLNAGTRDLHSGMYGNRVINPAQVLATLVAGMKDPKTGRVLIPGFYDDVKPISDDERTMFEHVRRSDTDEMAEAGVSAVVSLDEQQPWISSKRYPSLDVNGMWSGFTGEGQKTIIPRSASVKLLCRLVELQDPCKIESIIESYVKAHVPKGITVLIKKYKNASPFFTDFNNEYVRRAAMILEELFGNKTLLNRSGGSIPAAEILLRRYGKPVILTGFITPGENMHAPNENYDKDMFFKGITALERLYASE